MKNHKHLTCTLFAFLLSCIFSSGANSQITTKELNKMFASKGTYRVPFSKSKDVGFASVNLRFKLASRERTEKRNTGSVTSWAFLEGIDDQLFQEIADQYHKNLVKKFENAGYNINNSFKESTGYQTLKEKNSNNERETFKKNWGVAQVFTANNDSYIEYPVGMMGAHAKMGNDVKYPVGQLLITIDFAQILQSISKDTEYGFLANVRNTVTTATKATLYPVITIEGPTEPGINLKGDGTYAKFIGNNWGYSNAIIDYGKGISSEKSYALDIQSAKGMPEQMKRFKSNFLGDMASYFSAGLIGNNRSTGEFTFMVKADPEKYKAAVLDALDKYNDYLLAYIQANN